MVQRIFTCTVCPAEEKHPYEASPAHCGRYMAPGKPIFPNEQPGKRQMHMIRMKNPTTVQWQLTTPPDVVFELWQLKPAGRADSRSEFLGYLGKRATTWEWLPPNGVGIKPGFAPSGEAAAQCLILAMDGGAAARRVIAEIAS